MVGSDMPGGLQVSRKPWEPVIAGAVAGAASRLIISPFDVLKIRFQLQIESDWRVRVTKFLARI